MPEPVTTTDIRYTDTLTLLRQEAPQLGALLDDLDEIVGLRLVDAEDQLLTDRPDVGRPAPRSREAPRHGLTAP